MAVDTRELAPTVRTEVGFRLPSRWTVATVAVALLVALPIVVVFSRVFEPSDGVWAHLAATVLPDYLRNTALLMIGVGAIAAVLGVGTAWLVTTTRFPGVRFFEWALLLPMAVPAYVMAYVYTDLLEYSGPVQTTIRDLTGWGYGDYWFPEIRSLGGATVMLGLVLYPYVYLLTRAAFLTQSVCVLEVSRTLGCSPWRRFWTLALPLARPAIVAGLTLVMMETVADYGTVEYFGVPTFTTGIYRAWFGMGQPVAAAQLSATLLGIVLVLILLERLSRGNARYHGTSSRDRPAAPVVLHGTAAYAALAACALPVLLGFLVPAIDLAYLAIRYGDPLFGSRFLPFAMNSLILASVSAALITLVATIIAYGVRVAPTPVSRGAARFAAMGYAVPGSVIAVGVLIPFAAIDNAVDSASERFLGISTGLLLTGSIAALVFAYLVRFLAISFNTVEASLGRVSPNMDAAARTLGHGPGSTLARIHVPLIGTGLLSASLLVFVDVMKELPATLIMRPFNFDTLAIRVYRLAADERLAEASTAALAIVAVGILPVIVLSRAIARSRPVLDPVHREIGQDSLSRSRATGATAGEPARPMIDAKAGNDAPERASSL